MAAHQFIAERDCPQEIIAVAIGKFRGSERRWHDFAARMKTATQMAIVGLVAMGRHAVGERRVDGRSQDAGADHGGRGFPPRLST